MYIICSLHKNVCKIDLTVFHSNISLGSLYRERKTNQKIEFCIKLIYIILDKRKEKIVNTISVF